MATGKRTAVWGQLLLFAALLLGIVTMHTVGHPAQHPGAADPTATSMTPASPNQASGIPASGIPASGISAYMNAASMRAPSTPAAPVTGGHHPAATGPAVERPAAPAHAPMRGMDPGSVCVAVLGVWGVALLALRLLARGPAPHRAAAPRRRVPRPLWPNPPPPYGRSVAALSVLRQ
ncbi:hypothetical protein ACFWXK_39105 [Streptomyces sp. NPDC059070]|uniref:hypothetical protein n=1 Tax=Streptomyces sp. NPDC059070 TaxID=3346713 RepID=UPI0036B5C4EF